MLSKSVLAAIVGLRKRGGWTGDLITESSFIVASEQSITVNENARIDLQMKISIDNRPAPMGVVINLLDDSTFYGISNPQFECSLWTDLGDTGATFDNISSELNRNDANKSPGWITGHVYASTGTFTAVSMCKHHASGALGFAVHTFTSLDADTFYAGTKTICYDPDGVFSGAPSGATQVTTWTAAKDAMVASKENSRLMIAKGKIYYEDFSIFPGLSGVMRMFSGCQYTSFGTGSNPKFIPNQAPKTAGTVFFGEYFRNTTDGSIIFDIDFETDYSPVTGVGENYQVNPIFGPSMSGVTAWRVNTKGFGKSFYPYDDLGQGTEALNNLVYDCNFQDWQDLPVFGHFHNSVIRGCNIRQNENAVSGPGEKKEYYDFIDGDDATLVHTLTELAIFGDVANLAVFDYSPTDYLNRAIDRSISMRELILGVDYTFTEGTDATSEGAGDATHQITLTSAITTGRQLYYQLRNWSRHGPIRLERADGVGIIQNELRSKAGWSSQGQAHQPNTRWNTLGTESVGGYIGYNSMEGGFDVLSAGPANDYTEQSVTGPLVIEQNYLEGDDNTRYSIALGLSNVLLRNNVSVKKDVLNTFQNYLGFLYANKNTDTTDAVDVNPIISLNNTIVNETSTANGAENTEIIIEGDNPFPLLSSTNDLLYHEDRPTPWPVNYAPLSAANYYRPQEGSPALGSGTQNNNNVWDDFSGVLIDSTYSIGAFATKDPAQPSFTLAGDGTFLIDSTNEMGMGSPATSWSEYAAVSIPDESDIEQTLFGASFGNANREIFLTVNTNGTVKIETAAYGSVTGTAVVNDGQVHSYKISYISETNTVKLIIDGVDDGSFNPSDDFPIRSGKYAVIGGYTNDTDNGTVTKPSNATYYSFGYVVDEGGASENTVEWTSFDIPAGDGETISADIGTGLLTVDGSGITFN